MWGYLDASFFARSRLWPAGSERPTQNAQNPANPSAITGYLLTLDRVITKIHKSCIGILRILVVSADIRLAVRNRAKQSG